MLRSYEPPSVFGTGSGLVPPSFDVSRRPAPLCDNRAITSRSGTMLFGSIFVLARGRKLAGVNGRFFEWRPAVGRENSTHRQEKRPRGGERSTLRRDKR